MIRNQLEYGRIRPALSSIVTPMTEASKITPLVMNHDSLSIASLKPIIFINSRNLVCEGGKEGGRGRMVVFTHQFGSKF